MITNISAAAYIATAVFVVLLVVGRFAIHSYGQRIGANEMDFEYRSELERQRSLYQALKKGYRVLTVIAGLWIIALGAQLIVGAEDGLMDARRHGYALTSSKMLGALGAVVALAGIAVIVVPFTLRWDTRPDLALDARPPMKLRTASVTSSQSGADFSVLTDAVGDMEREEKRSVARWYNARPAVLWVMLAATALVLVCYLALFVAVVPIR